MARMLPLGVLLLLAVGTPTAGQNNTQTVALTLKKISNKQTDTSADDPRIYIGQVATLKATVDFSSLRGPFKDTYVHIMASPDNTTILALSNITVQSKNLRSSVPNWESSPFYYRPGNDDKSSIKYNTDASYYLGKVSKIKKADGNKDLSDISDYRLIIMYDVVCVSMGDHQKGDSVLTTVYIEFNNASHYEYADVSLTLRGLKDTWPVSVPKIDKIYDIEVLRPLTFDVNLTLRNPATDFEVKVKPSKAGTNELVVLEIRAKRVGEGFTYAVDMDYMKVVGYNSCPMNSSLSLKVGTLINRASMVPGADKRSHKLVLGITLLMTGYGDGNGTLDLTIKTTINKDTNTTKMSLNVLHSGTDQSVQKTMTINTPVGINILAGESSYLELNIQTPVLSYDDYNITFDALQYGLRVLSVTPVAYGTNLVCQDISSSSLTHAPYTRMAMYEFSLLNIGTCNESDANRLFLQVNVSMEVTAVAGSVHLLTIYMNGYSYYYDDSLFRGFIADDPILADVVSVNISNTCPTRNYYSGSLAAFRLTIVTRRNTMVSPITITTPPHNSSLLYSIHNATVVSTGKNIHCQSDGELLVEFVDGLKTEIFLQSLCNTGEVNSSEEDEIVIEITVTLIHPLAPSTQSLSAIFETQITVSQTFSYIKNLQFYIRSSERLGKTPKLISGYTDADSPSRLYWSIDNVEYHRVPSNVIRTHRPGNIWSKTKLKTPRFAQFVRVVNDNDGCLVPCVVTTSNESPIIIGPTNKTSKLARHFKAAALDWSKETCMHLPRPGTETTPYLWAELTQSLFGSTVSIPFNVTLHGYGLDCSSTSQVTMVVFPKPDPSAKRFENPHQQCDLEWSSGPVKNGPVTCLFKCACTNTFECSKFSLLMSDNSDTSNKYQLCDVSVTQYR